jgi:hypothetical protein
MLEPGNKINDMIITTGAEVAFPLWALCLPTVENKNLITVDCPEVPYSTLAIGHTFGLMDLVPVSFGWSDLAWEFYLDDQPVDLKTFGTYDFIQPDMAINPSPIREVFRKVTVWDVVLGNPTPGRHTLQGVGNANSVAYIWLVNFSIADSPSE